VKTRNTTTKLFAMVMAVGMLAAIWTIWGASRAEAVIAIIRQTGVFSIAQGQATSRIVRSKALFCIVPPRTDKGFYVLFIPCRLPPPGGPIEGLYVGCPLSAVAGLIVAFELAGRLVARG